MIEQGIQFNSIVLFGWVDILLLLVVTLSLAN
jgi:hypothetical protein